MLGEGERQPRTGGEGGGAGLFLNSASTRSLALWFLRVVYSIFLFLRRLSALRVRAAARGFVGSRNAEGGRGSLAWRRPPGHPRAGGGWTGGPRWLSHRLVRVVKFSREGLLYILLLIKPGVIF